MKNTDSLANKLLQEATSLEDTRELREAVNRATFLAQEVGSLKKITDVIASNYTQLWQDIMNHGFIPKNKDVILSEGVKLTRAGNVALATLREALEDLAIIVKRSK